MVPKVAPRSPLHSGCVKTEGLVPTRKTRKYRNGSNEKVKPISLTLQNNLKGVNTFKIVLFDNTSDAMANVGEIAILHQIMH